MKRKLLALVLLAAGGLLTTSCNQLMARDYLNKGVRSFRERKFDNAVDYFQKAIEKDPKLTTAQLYLATAYTQQFVPGSQSEENVKFAQNAIDTFQKVLDQKPDDKVAIVNATAGIASMYQHLGQYSKAKEYYLKQAELEPQNKVPFYSVGAVDWLVAYNKNGAPITPEEKGVLVDEGLKYLGKALEMDPQYEEAMTYTNLLYRIKAELLKARADATKDKKEKAELQKQHIDLIAAADGWFEKALEARKKNQEKAASNAGKP